MKTIALFAVVMLLGASNAALTPEQTSSVIEGFFNIEVPANGYNTDYADCVADFMLAGADIAEAVSDFQAGQIAKGCAKIADAVNVVPTLIDDCGWSPSEFNMDEINSVTAGFADKTVAREIIRKGILNNFWEVKRSTDLAVVAFEKGEMKMVGEFMMNVLVVLSKGATQ